MCYTSSLIFPEPWMLVDVGYAGFVSLRAVERSVCRIEEWSGVFEQASDTSRVTSRAVCQHTSARISVTRLRLHHTCCYAFSNCFMSRPCRCLLRKFISCAILAWCHASRLDMFFSMFFSKVRHPIRVRSNEHPLFTHRLSDGAPHSFPPVSVSRVVYIPRRNCAGPA